MNIFRGYLHFDRVLLMKLLYVYIADYYVSKITIFTDESLYNT